MAAIIGYSLLLAFAIGFLLFTESKAGKRWINKL